MSRPEAPSAQDARVVDLLGRLAKRNSALELDVTADGTRIWRLRGAPLGTRAIAQALFAAAYDAGWLTDADGNGLSWTLSTHGRAALRRHRSAGTGTPTTAPPLPAVPTGTASANAAESPLGWLRARRDKNGQPMISAIQFDAGERLRADLWFAQMTPRVTANWSAAGGGASRGGSGLGVDIADNAAAAQQRVRSALADVGPLSRGLLIDVCGFLQGLEQLERARGWPPRSGKIALQMALSELARHYGLPGTQPTDTHRPLHHWGLEDYRPVG